MIKVEVTHGVEYDRKGELYADLNGPDIIMSAKYPHPIFLSKDYKTIQIDLTKQQAQELIAELSAALFHISDLESLAKGDKNGK